MKLIIDYTVVIVQKNGNSTDVAFWHIHGEVGSSRGIVLSHDRYGRILKRIIKQCSSLDYKNLIKRIRCTAFIMAVALLFGYIYVIGFGYISVSLTYGGCLDGSSVITMETVGCTFTIRKLQ